MSIYVLASGIPLETLKKDLMFQIEEKFSRGVHRPKKYLSVFGVHSLESNPEVCFYSLPFGYARTKIVSGEISLDAIISIPNSVAHSRRLGYDWKYTGTRLPNQLSAVEEISASLTSNHSCLVCLHCGFGKTNIALECACRLGYHTLVMTHRKNLDYQWAEEVLGFTTGEMEILSSKTKALDPTKPIHVCRFSLPAKKGGEFFGMIGTLIVDEAHTVMSPTFSKSLRFIRPYYCLFLTATPKRADGCHVGLYRYCASPAIWRKLLINYELVVCKTGFKPEVVYGPDGRVLWGKLLDSIANSEEENQRVTRIVEILLKEGRRVLIPTKTTKHVTRILGGIDWKGCGLTDAQRPQSFFKSDQKTFYSNRLAEVDADSDAEVDAESKKPPKSKVPNYPETWCIVGTVGKLVEGFNWKEADAMVLAADIDEKAEQLFGRVMRRFDPEHPPIIVDIVHDNSSLLRHYYDRRKLVKETSTKGLGSVMDFDTHWIGRKYAEETTK